MAEQNGAQSRPPPPPGQYPSPRSYPSPEMQPTYAYPPPQGQPGEPYRHSPTASNTTLPPVNLPPLRSIDGHPQPPQLLAQQPGSQMSQQIPPMPGYYQPPPGMAHPGMSYARYPIPQGGGPMTGGRHKKEIKRRTKTGCLTCRKRRIKCDEQHPVCRNCQKSKRECAGYDPVFRQQSGSQTLQPAPSASPSSASPTPASTTSAPAPFSPRQPTYVPPHTGTYPPTPKTEAAPLPPHQLPPIYQYHAAIDPALAESPDADRKPPEIKHLQPPPDVQMESAKGRPAKQINVDDLFQVNRYGPYDVPANYAPLTEKERADIRSVYLNDFALGLDKVLETEWFSTYGLECVLADHALGREMVELIKHYTVIDRHHGPEAEARCRATESWAVWRLLSLCKPQSVIRNNAGLHELDLSDNHARLEVLECLITNRLLDERRVKPVQWKEGQPGWSKEKLEDLLFWAGLAKFTTRRNDDLSVALDMDKFLIQCRNLLNGKENRDVIYSIMVTRHYGWRVPGFPDHIQPEHGGENSAVNKVFIAKQFIIDEAQSKGTMHPIQRLCDMVVRSWVVGWCAA